MTSDLGKAKERGITPYLFHYAHPTKIVKSFEPLRVSATYAPDERSRQPTFSQALYTLAARVESGDLGGQRARE